MSDYWTRKEIGKAGITYRSGGLGAWVRMCMDHTERCGRYGNRKTVLQYLLSMSLTWGWVRREVPAETRAKLVLVSWPFCAISENHVAGAFTSLLEPKAERKDTVIPAPRSGPAMGSLLL